MASIVIIDDNFLFRRSIVLMVKYNLPEMKIIGEAGNFREGLDSVRSLRPDIILIDYELPDGKGTDIFDKIDYSPLIVLISGYDDISADEYDYKNLVTFQKPIQIADLQKILKTAGKLASA